MLHAPLQVETTAKLDISLLLKASPSPPPASSGRSHPSLARSTSVPAKPHNYPPLAPSSHRTSISSNASTSTTRGAQAGRTPTSATATVQQPHTYQNEQRPLLPPLTESAVSSGVYSSLPPQPPAHVGPHPAASPAKKQSKWTPEEDALIIELRGNNMKWDDIAERIPGRSAISCRLHYQNYLEKRSEWDEEKKNKLARLYDRSVHIITDGHGEQY
jgi:hypothetical protein